MGQELRVEFTTEPFIIGDLPPHAFAAHQAALEAGLQTVVGPFGTAATGDEETLLNALPELLKAALANGAQRITLQVTTPAVSPRKNTMHGALDRLILEIEVEMGQSVDEMDRLTKQDAVRRLHERGAFELRGSVEDVADHLGVSRFTVYNYLNSSS
jgi:uncharacterized protein YqgV (UPF0045/DUF77 family)